MCTYAYRCEPCPGPDAHMHIGVNPALDLIPRPEEFGTLRVDYLDKDSMTEEEAGGGGARSERRGGLPPLEKAGGYGDERRGDGERRRRGGRGTLGGRGGGVTGRGR